MKLSLILLTALAVVVSAQQKFIWSPLYAFGKLYVPLSPARHNDENSYAIDFYSQVLLPNLSNLILEQFDLKKSDRI